MPEANVIIDEAKAIALIAQAKASRREREQNLRQALAVAVAPDTKARALYLLARTVREEAGGLLAEALTLAQDPQLSALIHIELGARRQGDFLEHYRRAHALATEASTQARAALSLGKHRDGDFMAHLEEACSKSTDRNVTAAAYYYLGRFDEARAVECLSKAESFASDRTLLSRIEYQLSGHDAGDRLTRLYASFIFATNKDQQLRALRKIAAVDPEHAEYYLEYLTKPGKLRLNVMKLLVPKALTDQLLRPLFYKLLMYIPLYTVVTFDAQGRPDPHSLLHVPGDGKPVLAVFSLRRIAERTRERAAKQSAQDANTMAVLKHADPLAFFRDLASADVILDFGMPYQKPLAASEITKMILLPQTRRDIQSFASRTLPAGISISLGPAKMVTPEQLRQFALIIGQEPAIKEAYCATMDEGSPVILLVLLLREAADAEQEQAIARRIALRAMDVGGLANPVDVTFSFPADDFRDHFEPFYQAG